MQNIASLLPMGLAPARPNAKREAQARKWRADLDRRHAYLEAAARDPSDRRAVDEAHARELEAGPPEARIRRGSTFARPDVGLRDRNALVKLLATWEAIARGTGKADREAARREGKVMRRTVARTVLPVLRALVALALRHEHVHPSRARLASMADCCLRTVDAALAQLQALGFVTSTRRRKIVATPHGGRAVQDTNAYTLHEPRGMGAIAAAIFGRPDQSAKSAQPLSHQSEPGADRMLAVVPTALNRSRLTLWSPT